jgi:hypothetical protein
MIQRHNFTGRLLLALTMLGAIGSARLSSAQEADEQDEVVVRQTTFEVSDAQFDQWAFGGRMDGTTVRPKLESLLTMQIEQIDRSCHLTESQKKKLRLAGHGDMKRFLDRVEEKRSLLKGIQDRSKVNEIFQQIQTFQIALNSGLFGEESFFFRTIGRTLNEEQSARYQDALHERKAFVYQAKIDLAVANLGNSLGLSNDQRNRLAKLLLEETRPPRKYGQQAFQVVLFQVAKLPDARLKSILDEAQWRALSPSLARWGNETNERLLRANGYVPEDEPADREANPAQPTSTGRGTVREASP